MTVTQTEKQEHIKFITDNAQRVFLWKYDRDREQLVNLYNKGMASQWNSVTDLDWSIDVDPEKLVTESGTPNLFVDLAREAAKVDGSPFAKWSEKEFIALGIETFKAQLIQFMHGE